MNTERKKEMAMNKKDNRKSLMKHLAQIQQLKDQIKAKEDELAKLLEITRTAGLQ